MSGGAWNYLCDRMQMDGRFEDWDEELADLFGDLAALAHDLEWADSSDIDEEDARAAIRLFKAKWFAEPREKRLVAYVDRGIAELRERLMAVIGAEAVTPNGN